MRITSIIIGLLLAGCSPSHAQTPRPTFHNPLVSIDSPDPFITRYQNNYYFTATFDPSAGISLWKSTTLSHLNDADKVQVWRAPKTGPQSTGIWAPELYHFQNRWYLYYTATDGPDKNHRMFVLQSKSDNPLGEYEPRGQTLDPTLHSYAIDGSILTTPDGNRYFLYSTGHLFIVPMLSPTQLDPTRRVELARATEPWERHWLEAPEALVHNGHVFLTYSAGHSGTPHYSLGLLTLKKGTDPLNPDNWTKSKVPVFSPYFGPDGAAYDVGHNSFTTSPDGTEHWLLYHAKDWRTDEPKDRGFNGRTTRAQPFTWNPDGSPHFGHPIPTEVPLPLPSGE